MIYEIREYTIKNDRREEWVALMEEKIIPFQISCGIVVVASFVSDEDESTYVWIRRFADEQERTDLYETVYKSDFWQNEMGPLVEEMLDRDKIRVLKLVPTDKSVLS